VARSAVGAGRGARAGVRAQRVVGSRRRWCREGEGQAPAGAYNDDGRYDICHRSKMKVSPVVCVASPSCVGLINRKSGQAISTSNIPTQQNARQSREREQKCRIGGGGDAGVCRNRW